jgi:hypothetical protein
MSTSSILSSRLRADSESMENVAFIFAETGDDLIVSFAVADPAGFS